MATFRSGVKILSQVSKKQGCRTFQFRSYSDDRRTTYHRRQSPGWTTYNSRTPLQTSKSWFSLFRRKKSPENKLLKQECGCDLKETCESKRTENDSWLSFLKKKVSKDERPPLTCCRMHQARIRKEEEQKALQEGREPEGWKPDVMIVTKESNAPVICKTITEPQPQPPPQPPPPRAVEVLKENIVKVSSKTEGSCDAASKSFNMRLPYEEFKIPIQSAPPPPVSGDNLQPRKQSPYASGEKFKEGTNFQQCKKFHKQSNLEAIPLTKAKSKNIHKNSNAQKKGKTTGVLKPHIAFNINSIKTLDKVASMKDVKTSSRIIIPTKIRHTNLIPVPVPINETAIKQSNISGKTSLTSYKHHNSSNDLISEPPMQNIPNTATSAQRIHLGVINENNKTQIQNDTVELKLKFDKEAKDSSRISRPTKERKLTTKRSPKIIKEKNNLRNPTDMQSVKENSISMNKKNQDVNIKDNPTMKNKFLNLGINRSGDRSTSKYLSSSKITSSHPENTKRNNKSTEECSPSKNGVRCIKSSINLKSSTNHDASSKITSSHSLPNINKNNKQNEEPATLKKAGGSINTTTPSPNSKPEGANKLSQANLKSESSTKKNVKESWEQTKGNNVNPICPNDESFISAWKANYSYVGFPRKARIPKKEENLKLSKKGNEGTYQLSLPSNIEPFVRLGEGVHLWSTPEQPIPIEKQTKKTIRKAPKLPNEEKEPWFTECQTNYVDTDFPQRRYSISKSRFKKIRKGSNNDLIGNKITYNQIPSSSYKKVLKYGGRNVLDSKLTDKAKCQKEEFLTTYFSFGNANDNSNLKIKRKDANAKQNRIVDSKLIGTNCVKNLHIKQNSHNEINNCLKDTNEILSQKQEQISNSDALYINDISLPSPCQLQMEESLFNDQYESSLYTEDNLRDDLNSTKTRDNNDYYIQSYDHDKNMDASLSNIQCKNLMTDSSVQSPHSNHENFTASSSNVNPLNMKSPNITRKHIPFSYEKSYGQWGMLESGAASEKQTQTSWQQVDPNIENVIVTLPKPRTSGSCLTNTRHFPNQIVKHTFSSYVGNSSCNQHNRSHNQQTEQSVKEVLLIHEHLKKSKKDLLACPGMSLKKNKAVRHKKNKRQKATDDSNEKYYDCVDTQPFEFKNTNSKPTMKYTKQNFMLQQFQPIKRCYSSYSCNKAFPSFRVLNRITTQNNEHLKCKNSFSTLDSKTRSVEYARKDKNTSCQSTIFQPPKYISKDQKNYFQLRNIHSDSEVHRFRRTDLIDFFKQTKQFTTGNPLKLNPPQPSFAECIEDPKAETKSTGHKETAKNKCSESNKVKSLVCLKHTKNHIEDPKTEMKSTGDKETVKKKCSESNKVKSLERLKHTKNHQKLLLLPREHYKEKKQKTDYKLVKGGNVSYDKEDKSDLLTFTKLPIKCSATQYLIGQKNQLMHSQSYFKLKSIQPSTIQYGNALQYARNASSYTYIEPFHYGSKVTAPGCKPIKTADCKSVVKVMPPCNKALAPKPSYSECLREKTPPRLFTECIIRKTDKCPGEKVVKSYDGCAPKKKEVFICPEPEPEKSKLKKKKKECDECEDVEPFKFKSDYSKPPMKCSSRSTSISQPNLPPVRSYSNIKIMLPEKSKLPSRVASYINCQTKNLKERISSGNERSGLKSKQFEFETMSPTGYSGDDRLKEHLSFTKSSIRPYETILSPDKVSLKKDIKFIGLLKQPPLKIKPTYRNLLNHTKEEKPQKNPVGVNKDRYVKISLGHSKTSSKKKKAISDIPLNPRLEPCLGQVRRVKKEKVLRKDYAVDPSYSALSFTKNKRDTEKKSTQNLNDRSSLANFPSISLESAKKYSTSKLKDNEDFSKTSHMPECLSGKSLLTMVNFTPPKIKIKNDTSNNKKMQVPVTLKTSSVDFTGNVFPTKRSNQIKSRSNDITINFSPSANKTKTNRDDKKNGSMMQSAHSIDLKMNVSSSKQKTNIKHCQKCVFPTNFFLPKTSNKMDFNLTRMQIASPISNLPITVKNNVSSTISNYKIESCKLNSSPKMTSLRNETSVKNQISTLTLKEDANSSKTLMKKSTVNKFVISRKRGRDSIISVSMLKHKTSPDSKIICETARKKEGEKESVKNVSSNITEPSDESDPSPKTEYIVTTNRDGNVEDLFSTIKSWFSFLKTKEGFPQSESEITENQVAVSPCKTNHIKEFPSDPLRGNDVSNCLQSGKVKFDCKDLAIHEPEISECPEELLQTHSLAECYPQDLACETDPPSIKPSACEMYFTKNKKFMKTKNHTSMKMRHHENVMLPEVLRPTLTTTLAKHQNPKTVMPQKVTMAHEKSEQPTSAESCPNNSKINIFSELLSKKSTLQEWHANPQFEMKVHGKVLNNKYMRANNQIEDIIQTVHEDKLNTSTNTEETLKEQNLPGLKSLDKEIAVKKHNERNEIPDSPSNIKALLHHDNLEVRKMSNSVSPINKELGCTVSNKNIFPHPTVKIRPEKCSVHGTKVTFKVKGKNHTIANKTHTNNGLNKIKNKHRSKHAVSKQAKSISNRCQSEKSTYYDAPTYSSDTCNEMNTKPKESTTSNGYLALINKFPDIMGRSRGTNYFSDIWSCRQKDLPVNFILKVTDPVYPKANPKLDLKILKPVSQDVDAECEDIEDHQPQSSNKVSQRENMAKEFSSIKANPGLSTLEYVLSCNKHFSLNDITLLNQDIKFRIQSFYWNPGFQRTLAFFECVPQKLSNTIHTNEICGLYMTEFSIKQIQFILFSSKMKPKNISVRYSGWSLTIPRREVLDKLFQYLKQNLSYYGNISYKRDNLVLYDNEKHHARLSQFLTVEPKINRMHTSVSCIGLHNRPYKILSYTLNLFPLCSCSGKHKQFLMVPSLVQISPRHKSSKSFCDDIKDMFSKKGNSEICTEKSGTKDEPVRKEEKKTTHNPSGSGESDETCKEKERQHFVDCKEPPKKEKHKCETEKEKVKEKVECLSDIGTDSICPPTKRPIKKIPCEKMETKEVKAEKKMIEESPCGSKEILTKEEIEARKKTFKITELSPVKNPPPLPPCEKIVHTGPEERTGPSEEKADCIETVVTCPPKEPECICTETTVTQPPAAKPPKETDGSCTQICPPKKRPVRRKK